MTQPYFALSEAFNLYDIFARMYSFPLGAGVLKILAVLISFQASAPLITFLTQMVAE